MGASTSSQLLSPRSDGTILVRHARAWLPFVSFSGSLSSALTRSLTALSMDPAASLSTAAFLAALNLTPAQLSELTTRYHDDSKVLSLITAPILATRVSAEDALISLNMLIDDLSSGDAEDVSGTLEGISSEVITELQEAFDALVERIGPEGEGRKMTEEELTQVIQVVPRFQQPALLTKLTAAIQEQGMSGDSAAAATSQQQRASPPPVAASSAIIITQTSSSSSSSSGSTSSGNKKRTTPAASSSASSGAASGFGGGLDLSISGVSIKAPAGFGGSSTASKK